MLVHQYKLFKIDPTESIISKFTRFTDIINKLKRLEKVYTNSELVRKILRSLSRTWEAKVTAIEEVKDLNKRLLEEVIGQLMTHELAMGQYIEEESRKKKIIILKSTAAEEVEGQSTKDDDDEDMALMIKKFKKFMGRRR